MAKRINKRFILTLKQSIHEKDRLSNLREKIFSESLLCPKYKYYASKNICLKKKQNKNV